MASFNKVILMGNLTRDPSLGTLPSQTSVCDFSLAVNRRWKGTQGEPREEVLFIDCTAFGKTGEAIAKHLKKGGGIHVEGYLKLDTWDQDGSKRSKIRVIVQQFRFVGSGKAVQPTDDCQQRVGKGKPQANGRSRRPAANGKVPAQRPVETAGAAADEEIPF